MIYVTNEKYFLVDNIANEHQALRQTIYFYKNLIEHTQINNIRRKQNHMLISVDWRETIKNQFEGSLKISI